VHLKGRSSGAAFFASGLSNPAAFQKKPVDRFSSDEVESIQLPTFAASAVLRLGAERPAKADGTVAKSLFQKHLATVPKLARRKKR
jgi:hypothetical protein